MNLENRRVVLITGASSGIGRACALYLGQRGFQVYGTSRRIPPQPAEDILSDAARLPSVTMLAMDVTDDRSVEAAVAAVIDKEGRLDVLVNNAGSGFAGAVEETSIADAKEQFEVNFFGAFRVCRAVLPAMRKQGHGYVVNIGSIGGVIAIPYQAIYSASKFALEGLSEALRLEAAPLGIRVVVIQPGDHKTEFTMNRRLVSMHGRCQEYAEPARVAIERMCCDEQHGPGPDEVARLLYRVLNTRNPRLRYTVGPGAQRAAVWLKRLLPNRVTEIGIRKYYRL
jgi:NAD(P)-dependent dehydrogenase (short-subunit alcohol dehydrogenase family)